MSCPKLTIVGAFTILYGFISVKIKQDWYLGEALPAVIIGIVLGPVAAKFLDSERWGHSVKEQTEYITLVVTRHTLCCHLLTFPGHDPNCDWYPISHGRLPTSCKVSLGPVERHVYPVNSCDDYHVAVYNRVHNAHDPQTHSST